MSLVAYGSSGESSVSEGEEESAVTEKATNSESPALEHAKSSTTANISSEDKISDSDSDTEKNSREPSFVRNDNENIDTLLKGLPEPKEVEPTILDEDDELEDEVKPKASQMANIPKPPPKKAKQPVQITIPALPDSEEDEPAKKKAKHAPSSEKSGLIALLPAPMFAARKEANRILVPHTLSRKPKPSEKKTTVPKTVSQPSVSTASKVTTGLTNYRSDSDDEEEDGENGDSVNFFSIGSSPSKTVSVISTPPVVQRELSVPTVPLPPSMSQTVPLPPSMSQTVPLPPSMSQTVPLPPSMSQTVPLPPSMSQTVHTSMSSTSSNDDDNAILHSKLSLPSPKHLTDPQVNTEEESDASNTIDPNAPLTFKGGAQAKQRPVYSHPRPYQGTEEEYYNQYADASGSLEEDEMFLRMQGKKQRGKEEINIVDVNADDFISTVEVSKNLSEEQEYQAQHKKEHMPTSQQKKKHHISYLAFQAKERELELKNQWASNRVTKQQTQAKYGF